MPELKLEGRMPEELNEREYEILRRDIAKKFPWLPINGEYRVADYILDDRKKILEEIRKPLEKFKNKFTEENWGDGVSHIYIDNTLSKIKELMGEV